jgi:hypothetical protein
MFASHHITNIGVIERLTASMPNEVARRSHLRLCLRTGRQSVTPQIKRNGPTANAGTEPTAQALSTMDNAKTRETVKDTATHVVVTKSDRIENCGHRGISPAQRVYGRQGVAKNGRGGHEPPLPPCGQVQELHLFCLVCHAGASRRSQKSRYVCGDWPSGPGIPVRARTVIAGWAPIATSKTIRLCLFPLLPGMQKTAAHLALQHLVELGRFNPSFLLGCEPFHGLFPMLQGP